MTITDGRRQVRVFQRPGETPTDFLERMEREQPGWGETREGQAFYDDLKAQHRKAWALTRRMDGRG